MRPKRVFLITIDTLRADRLGCYGYNRPTSPNLDALARDGVLYPYAFSPGSYTVPVHVSLLTGIKPVNHEPGFGQARCMINPDRNVFLQEIMGSRGYSTAGFVSSFVLRKEAGFGVGFTHYDDRMFGAEANRPTELIRDGMETTSAALGWIKANRDNDFFVWIHYFDVHGPYTAPRAGADFDPDGYGEPLMLGSVPEGAAGGIPEYQLLGVSRDGSGNITGYERDARHYFAAYDRGVRYQDKAIGALLDGLKGEGLYDDSLIVVTADHGEALGENGVYFFHGLTVTPEQTRVPLIFKLPEGFEGLKALTGPVSTLDIMPTILDLAGFPRNPLPLDGTSLLEKPKERFVLSENEWQRAVIGGDLYLLQGKETAFDGFTYYFDARELCSGTALLDYKKNIRAQMDPHGPASPLLKFAGSLKALDPLEARIKEKDRLLLEKEADFSKKEADIASKEAVIASKEAIIASLEKGLLERDAALGKCASELGHLNMVLGSVYGSKSWRLTSPLRNISASLKGIRKKIGL